MAGTLSQMTGGSEHNCPPPKRSRVRRMRSGSKGNLILEADNRARRERGDWKLPIKGRLRDSEVRC